MVVVVTTTERITVNLPEGFDASRHGAALLSQIVAAHGAGWEIVSVDPDARKAYAVRQATLMTVTESPQRPGGQGAGVPGSGPAGTRRALQVRLPRETKPSDGDRVAARLADQYAGYYLYAFEPFLGKATLAQLTDEEARCRAAVAVALGVKPWEVTVQASADGGFLLRLARCYVPSRHDARLSEVARLIVGRNGWRAKTDPNTLLCRFVPGDPPLFPPTVPFPLAELGTAACHRDRTLIGVCLPEQGQGVGPRVEIDWAAQAFVLLAGQPGSGKTVTLNCLVAQQLAAGAELVVVDDKSKAVDFLWCKDFVRPGGWGCDSEAGAAAALAMVYEEGQRRAKLLADLGHVNWLELPPEEQFKPVLILVDEVAALLVQDPVPKGVPKGHPIVVEVNELNMMRALIGRYVNKIVAEQRFVGMRMVLPNQVTNQGTGLPPSLKNKIGHRIRQGTNPSKPARLQTFNDERSVPAVPEHIRACGAAARGVGVADLEGSAPVVYKSMFTPPATFRQWLPSLGVPRTSQPAPTPAQLARHSRSLG